MIDVAIVIVCMNNLKNLYPCLESIRKYTSVTYETLVVAYLFTPDNLRKAKEDFPWVTFIESNESEVSRKTTISRYGRRKGNIVL